MKGAGYFHPQWAHGLWHDELSVAGEEAKVEDLDTLAPDCIHVQQVIALSSQLHEFGTQRFKLVGELWVRPSEGV